MAAPLSDQFGPGGAALRLISQDFARFSRQWRQEFAAKPVEDAAERAFRQPAWRFTLGVSRLSAATIQSAGKGGGGGDIDDRGFGATG
jgi:hypothetical protein